MSHHFYDLCRSLDISTIKNSFFCAGKRCMLNELEATTMVYKSIASNTRSVVVSFSKSSIYYHESSIRFDRFLTFSNLYRNMSIYNMSMFSLDAKLVHNIIADGRTIAQFIIPPLLFDVSTLICNKIPFECGHLGLIEKRAFRSTP